MQLHDSVEIVISDRELLQSSSLSAATVTATARISIVSCWRRVYVKVADDVGSRFWWKVALVKKDDFEDHLRGYLVDPGLSANLHQTLVIA